MNGSQRKDRLGRLDHVPWLTMGFALAAVFIAVRALAVWVLQ